MCINIWSTFFLTQCAIGVLDMFTFAAERSTSVRSTPAPLQKPSTAFENLEFWSGESLKFRPGMKFRDDNDCEKTGKGKNDSTYKNVHFSKTKLAMNEDGSRRRLKVYGSHLREAKYKVTRFSDLDNSSTTEDNKVEKVNTNMKMNGYTLLQDITSIMNTLPDVNTSVSVLAKTIEVHDIVLCKMSKPQKRGKFFRTLDDKYVDEQPNKKIIFIVHGLTPMGFRDIPCLYRKESFKKLVQMYAKHLDHFDIFLIPMGNPDGIADETLYLWNKNKNPLKKCSGVDLDRNFDVHWNRSHAFSRCSQRFPGLVPFSEPESRAVADLLHFYNNRIVAYIHVHGGTYNDNEFKGDAVLYPKGYSPEGDNDHYNDMQAGIEESLRNAGFKVYSITMTSLYNWYGQVDGTSVDYATTVYGIPFGLEFVMQSYKDVHEAKTISEETQDNVLTEVWQRIIDVVFDTIFKSVDSSEETT